ncbi:hypothetical protein J3B02_001404 [Coemansia erecta]|uniref:Uncharacterized protein n=1 Tax=Coemansia asiatica TaxID=1052880 RepID=A0A9W8CJP5_9FUNG|nr:hypothetical protein LPJ64_003791 [Coemansia asiatica]KAJ2856782.1 hypothetical protein J3B02_001404 [Coemansia erecta]KAJ2867837.1 hypothetical protein FB639_004911 [Coemansia asiatica]
MNIFRFLVTFAFVLLASAAFVVSMPVEEASTSALAPNTTTSPSSAGLAAAIPPPPTPETTGHSGGPAAHATIGQVVFGFVTGMLAIVEDTIRGYLLFGTTPAN